MHDFTNQQLLDEVNLFLGETRAVIQLAGVRKELSEAQKELSKAQKELSKA